ncbi:MAG: molybdopterin converting factor subunit 1 [Phycisphaerales bacterium]
MRSDDETDPVDVVAFASLNIPSIMSTPTSIRVLLFAQASEVFGRSELVLDLVAPVTVGAVLDHLRRESPEAARLLDACAFAVNESYATVDRTVEQGDTVALIPPVSGG